MNKKAWVGILTVIFIGITISVIIYAYYKPYETSVVMGRQQSAIMEAYSVNEQARRFSSDAAYLSGKRALLRLEKDDCTFSDAELNTFKTYFEEEFYKYLSGFKLPVYKEEDVISITLGTEAEGPKRLSDIVDYKFEITAKEEIIIIEGFPRIEDITIVEYINETDEDGKETDKVIDTAEVTYTVESAIMISSEKYAFEYSVDPYFITTIDCQLHRPS
jgi:hypothetical protein